MCLASRHCELFTEGISKYIVIAVFLIAITCLFTPYEIVFERILAALLVLAVIIGFSLRPTSEVFYVHTAARVREPSGNQVVERDLLAVKVELVRLWLLFLPTAAAVALLVVSSALESSFFNRIASSSLAPFWLVPMESLFIVGGAVLGALGMWTHERWIIRHAEACSATSFTVRGRRVTYAFAADSGELFGGDFIYLGLAKPPQLSTVVFYKSKNLNWNKIAMGFLFHKLVFLGRGVTELDKQTGAARIALTEIISSS
jgi:hypothetical protein